MELNCEIANFISATENALIFLPKGKAIAYDVGEGIVIMDDEENDHDIAQPAIKDEPGT